MDIYPTSSLRNSRDAVFEKNLSSDPVSGSQDDDDIVELRVFIG